MLDKTRGAVGCGHCKGMDASETCPRCGQLVCVMCLEEESCSVPQPVELRLGIGARLRQVDRSGRTGVVSSWSGRVRVVDLKTGEVLEEIPWWKRNTAVDTFTPGGHWPLLVAPDRLMWVQSSDVHLPRIVSKEVGGEEPQEQRVAGWEKRRSACLVQVTRDARHGLVVRADHKLDVLDLKEMRVLGVLGERRQIIQSCTAAGAMDLMAVGGFRKAAFYQLHDVERLGSRSLGEGEVDWIGLGGGRAVMISDDGFMEVAEVDPARPPHRWPRLSMVDLEANIKPVADLSPDGELLALRMRRKEVEVFNLTTGARQTLGRHTDDVVLVRFVSEGQRLITADEDNRVMIWPRVGDRILEE